MQTPPTYRVLLLEDDAVQARLIHVMLGRAQHAQFVIETTNTVATGLQLLAQHAYDVVLFEFGLLDSSGWDTFIAIQPNAARVALVVMTNSSDEELGIKALRYGAQDYLIKSTFNGALLSRSLGYAIERHRLAIERERALAQAHDQFKEVERLKSKFVSELSHELRTPLTSIQLYVQLLQRATPEKSAKYYAIINDQVDRLRKLADDVLALSRGELTQRRPTVYVAVDLIALVKQIISTTYEHVSAEFGLLLACELPDKPVVIQGEPNQLTYALSHLLDNALHFTQQGVITIAVAATDSAATISVSDTGVGIPEDELDYVFDRFYRGEQAIRLAISGSGLGLAIVAEIVRLHGGSIELESHVGHGTTVRITFPSTNEPEAS